MYFFFFKQKTAYEMRISAGVQTCALPISVGCRHAHDRPQAPFHSVRQARGSPPRPARAEEAAGGRDQACRPRGQSRRGQPSWLAVADVERDAGGDLVGDVLRQSFKRRLLGGGRGIFGGGDVYRSEEHTTGLQSL